MTCRGGVEHDGRTCETRAVALATLSLHRRLPHRSHAVSPSWSAVLLVLTLSLSGGSSLSMQQFSIDGHMCEILIVNDVAKLRTLTSVVLPPVAVVTKSCTSRDKKPRTLEKRPCWSLDMMGVQTEQQLT